MIQLNFNKAFDLARYEVLESISAPFHVGQIILEGVWMASKGCATRIVVNDSASKSIPKVTSVTEGFLRHRNCLVCTYWLPSYSVSALASKSVRGYTVNAAEIKMSAYADDLVFFFAQTSVTNAVELTKCYCEAAGAAVNCVKSYGYWHGTLNSVPLFADWRSSSSLCTCHRVPLQHYRVRTILLNEVTKSLKAKVDSWTYQDLAIFGRFIFCSLFLVAKLWHLLQVLAGGRINI